MGGTRERERNDVKEIYGDREKDSAGLKLLSRCFLLALSIGSENILAHTTMPEECKCGGIPKPKV